MVGARDAKSVIHWLQDWLLVARLRHVLHQHGWASLQAGVADRHRLGKFQFLAAVASVQGQQHVPWDGQLLGAAPSSWPREPHDVVRGLGPSLAQLCTVRRWQLAAPPADESAHRGRTCWGTDWHRRSKGSLERFQNRFVKQQESCMAIASPNAIQNCKGGWLRTVCPQLTVSRLSL